LEQAAAAAGVPVQVPHATGLLTLFFSARPVTDYDGAREADAGAFATFFNEMLARGVYLPPSPFEAWFPSLAHGDDDLDRTLDAAADAFEAVARA
jgi:glutamate-1-semialdehyde 2,1-aminomutase